MTLVFKGNKDIHGYMTVYSVVGSLRHLTGENQENNRLLEGGKIYAADHASSIRQLIRSKMGFMCALDSLIAVSSLG